jgi:hypothetical protein
MEVGAGTTHLEFEFYQFDPPEQPPSVQVFNIRGDGSVDLDLTGRLDVEKKATFNGNVEIATGNLTIQDVNILEEINAIKQFIGMAP